MHQGQLGKDDILLHSFYSSLEHASGLRHYRCFLPRSILWFTFHTAPGVKDVTKAQVEMSLQTVRKMPRRCCSGRCYVNCLIPKVFLLLKERVRQGLKVKCKAQHQAANPVSCNQAVTGMGWPLELTDATAQ